MGRWMPDAGERLERAAFELFAEQGFAETTVPQIAERAGLTTRSFFRYYSDKREVLFGFDEHLPEIIAGIMAEADPTLSPMDVIRQSLDTVATTQLAGQLDYLLAHRQIVDSDDGLRERSLRKQAIMTEAIEQGFRQRGLPDLTATLSAHLAVAVFAVSVDRWLELRGERPLTELVHEALDSVRAVASGSLGQ